jgi:sigma-B regulation protein RsbU (phosphoserine phosphatase)
LHYLSVCDHDLLSRVALADISGHGREVSKVAEMLHLLMRENVNAWDQSDFMHGINEAFRSEGDGKYATAISLSYHRLKGRLAFTNAGHLPPLWYHAATQTWGWLEEAIDPRVKAVSGLPVGLIPGTNYLQTVVPLALSDILILYTDGITEAENSACQELGRQQLLEWARQGPVDSPASTGEALMGRLQAFRGCVHNDDETLLVLQRKKESLPLVLCELAGTYALSRFNKSSKSS